MNDPDASNRETNKQDESGSAVYFGGPGFYPYTEGSMNVNIVKGFAVEIQGYKNETIGAGASRVFLARETIYRIRLYNFNPFMCTAKLIMDDREIGTFLLNKNSKCDVSRPVERNAGFKFGIYRQVKPSEKLKSQKTTPEERTQQLLKSKSIITATFKPESGSQIIQVNLNIPSENSIKQLELSHDMPVCELFTQLKDTVGDWVLQNQCALINWLTREGNSTVQNVFYRHDAQPIRMSGQDNEKPASCCLISHTKLIIENIESKDSETINLENPPYCRSVLDAASQRWTHFKDRNLYVTSPNGRLLFTSSLTKTTDMRLLLFMHKDEIMADLDCLKLCVSMVPPRDHMTLQTRDLDGNIQPIVVAGNTSVQECRYHLECLGGPPHQGATWLFGGVLLESSRTLNSYDINAKSALDVIPKTLGIEMKELELKPAIAVENTVYSDAEEMARSADTAAKRQSRHRKAKLAKVVNNLGAKNYCPATAFRGRVEQQYIEVAGVDVDDQHSTSLSLTLLPKELASVVMNKDQTQTLKKGKAKSETVCVIL